MLGHPRKSRTTPSRGSSLLATVTTTVLAATLGLATTLGSASPASATPNAATPTAATSHAAARDAQTSATADRTTAAGMTLNDHAVPSGSQWATEFAEATGPDGRPWFLGTDGTIAREDADGGVSSFSVSGPRVDSGWTLIGVATRPGQLWTADRGDDSVRRITRFGSSTVFPVGATPRGVYTAGSDGEWVTTDDSRIVHLQAGGLLSTIRFRSWTPGTSEGVQAITDDDGGLTFVVPGQPFLWSVTTDDVITRVVLPDYVRATTITKDGDDVLVGLEDGSVVQMHGRTVVSTWRNPTTSAVVDQIVVDRGTPWFRETIGKRTNAVGYLDGGFHVVESHPVAEDEITDIAAGTAGVVVGWGAGGSTSGSATGRGSRSSGRTGLETFRADGTRTFTATPVRSGTASAPVTIDASAVPTYGTADGHVGSVRDVDVQRLAGTDSWSTAVAAAERAYPSGAGTVVIVGQSSSTDSVVAVPAAAKVGAPLLPVADDHLPSAVSTAITTLGARRAVIIGDTDAVGDQVEQQLTTMLGAGHVRRIAGSNAPATSERVARWAFGLDGATGSVLVAAAEAGSPDALTAAAAIGSDGPVLVVDGGSHGHPSTTTASTLRSLHVGGIAVVGSTSDVSAAVAKPLAAVAPVHRVIDAHDPTVAVPLTTAYHSATTDAVLAGVHATEDTVAAAALAARTHAQLLFATQSCVAAGTLATIATSGTDQVSVVGSDRSLSPSLDHLQPCDTASYAVPSGA